MKISREPFEIGEVVMIDDEGIAVGVVCENEVPSAYGGVLVPIWLGYRDRVSKGKGKREHILAYCDKDHVKAINREIGEDRLWPWRTRYGDV